MPITVTTFSVNATPKFDDPPDYDWNGKIELKLNTAVLTAKQCSQLQQQLIEMIAANESKFEDFTSTVQLTNWETKSETEVKLRQKVAKRLDDLAFDEDEAPMMRDVLIDEEKAKSWPISGKELEITNELLAQYGFEPLEKEELKA